MMPRLKDGAAGDAGIAAALDAAWSDPPGVFGWFCAVNHKNIARRFIVTCFAFFAVAALMAAVMRTQLARPENDLVGPDRYNQLFTTHGTAMMFLFAVPVMQAVASYLLPLMLGTRNLAFPRLNAFAYWIFLFGGLTLFIAFALNTGPDAGWFAYVPLSGPGHSPGKRVDIWAQMITFTELSALLEAIVLITTVFKYRAPGMSMNRIPLFVWATLVTSFMVLFAMPAVMFASSALIMDRLVGTHFFDPAAGGDAILWQHLFWFFGHPEVYLVFLPGLGFLSAMIPTFSRRPMFGYAAIVMSLIATAFLSFGLWVHHMFATNLPELGKSFFTAASMLIAIPSAIQIYCWIATIATGKLNVRVPMLYCLSFFFVLVIGGMTGLMLASVPLDTEIHDTYFVVAHLHYVLIGGGVFPLFGALHYWFPKVTGRMMDEIAGRAAFWLMFLGFNVAFFPMHVLGLLGMPRRVWTYPAGLGWDALNLMSTVGAYALGFGVFMVLVNAIYSARAGVPAGADPWGAGTLEWATASPPPVCNFYALPVVHGRDPVWQRAPASEPVQVGGLAADAREQLVTSVIDALPDHRVMSPAPGPWPFLTAVATTILFIGSIFTPWAIVWGSAIVAVPLVFWFWPKRAETEVDLALEKRP